MRKLTINTNQTWQDFKKNALICANRAADTGDYQPEKLNFSSSAAFFMHLNERKWRLLNWVLENKKGGAVAVRELARPLKRDVKRVHGDAQDLAALGLLEKTETGAIFCPYDEIHIDMVIKAAGVAA